MYKTIFFAGVAVLISAGCQRAGFSSRAAVLEKSVFQGTSGELGGGEGSGQSGSEAGGSVPQPGSGEAGGQVAQPPGGKIPVKFLCSMAATEETGTGVLKAAALQLKISDPSGAVICDVTHGTKDSILKTRTIDISVCKLTGNVYTMRIFDPAKPGKDLFYTLMPAFLHADYVTLSRPDSTSPWKISPHLSPVTTPGVSTESAQAGADRKSELALVYATHPTADRTFDASQCDMIASPLVINMTANVDTDYGMQLSSPARGVWFDILGLNSFPYARAKKHISWIQNPNYMFLALPSRGRVSGVDQLFGDNTQGPDYRFAENGFAALMKYDNNEDGRIDSQDSIFSALRLWSDQNKDGISQSKELKDFTEMNITEIDLHIDETYFEEDQYGNQSRYKSTVKTGDGKFHMVFDLWFKIP